jgi:hypothetical protein
MNNLSESAKKQARERPEAEIASTEEALPPPEISKRAARRLLQRAFVLVGRDRTVRQHIREARVITLWSLEDWGFEWTVGLDRGKLHFDRRPSRAPDLTLTWPSAEEFFKGLWEGKNPDDSLVLEGDLRLRRFADPIYGAFCRLMRQVMQVPFDEAGNRLW